MRAGRFETLYGRLNSGWTFACRYSFHNVQFPIPMLRNDHWVFAAYMMKRDPRRFYNPHIADAYYIENPLRGMDNVRSAVRSLILTYNDSVPHDEHLRGIAERTGIPFLSLQAYESLFYNVLDRRTDSICIALSLYPNPGGRLIELSENYFKESPMGKMLERVGHNFRDSDLSAYLAGLGDRSYLAKLAASDNSEAELSRQIMGNGLLLARTNLLNHRSPGWSRSTTLLSAARQAGQAVEEPAMSDIAYSFRNDFEEARRVSRAHTIRTLEEDAGLDLPPE